jgi:hypothetical protein
MAIELTSVVHCPRCGFERAETMPTAYCQIRYTCRQCGAELRPLPGDCCIFCSFGSVRCPPEQRASDDCGRH